MTRPSFLRRTVRRVFRGGASWIKSVGRYNEHFPRIFRAGKWHPSSEGSVWMNLFGMQAGPLSLVSTRRRREAKRTSLSRLLRVEGLERRQMLSVSSIVNFDALDATAPPMTAVSGAPLDNYLDGFGITLSDVSANITPSVENEFNSAHGFHLGSAASSPNYFITQNTDNNPYSFQVDFATPLSSFGFTRITYDGSGPSGLIVSGWSARALDSNGMTLSTVSEGQLAFFGASPARNFTLSGDAISAVVFERTSPNTIAGLNAVPTDDWILTPANQAPVASFVTNSPIVEGENLVLDASGSFDPEGDALSYAWDLDNDGAPDIVTTDAVTTARWIEELALNGITDNSLPGAAYQVALVVTDSTGLSSAPATAMFTVDNTPPTVEVSGPTAVVQYRESDFAFTTRDPGDDTVTQWHVSWGDGSAIQSFPAGPRQTVDLGSSFSYTTTTTAQHTYSAPGTFTITAEAVDEDCNTIASLAVTVNPNSPPTWTTPSSVSVPENSPVSIGLEATDDWTPVESISFTITGGADQGLFEVRSEPALTPRQRLVSVPFAFNHESPDDSDGDGIYDVEVTARDSEGRSTAQLFHITVTDVNELPVANAGGPYHTVEGQGVQLDGSASRDPEGRAIVKYEWDFDYNAGAGFHADLETSSATPFCRWIEELASRGITDDGHYTMALVVTDSAGDRSAPATAMFTVDNAPPTLDISGGHVVAIGHDYTFMFTTRDPGDDTVTTAWINWGDGNEPEMVTIPADAGQFDPITGETRRTFVASHVFETKGSYSVSFEACDEDCDGPDANFDMIPDDAYQSPPFTVTVSDAPVAEAAGPYTTTEDSTLVLDATRSSDDESIGTFTWTQVGGPFVARGVVTGVAPGTSNITRVEWDLNGDGTADQVTDSARLVVPAHTLSPGTYTFELTVTDNIGLSSSDTTTVQVQPAGGVRVAVGDVNGDGRADLAVICLDSAQGCDVSFTVDSSGPVVMIVVSDGGSVRATVPLGAITGRIQVDGGTGADHVSYPAGGALPNIQFDGNDGSDLFTVTATFSDMTTADVTEIVFHGGTSPGDNDALECVSFNYAKIEFKYTSPSDGKVILHDASLTTVCDITYTGLEPILFSGDAVDSEFTLPATDDNATLTNNNDGTLTLTGAFETTTFTTPSGSLTIHGGGGNDALTVTNSVSVPSITLDTETVNLGGDLAATTIAGGVNTSAVNVQNTTAQIQDAIALVAATGTVNVAAGTYVENLVVNKPMHLAGVDETVVTVLPATSGANPGGAGALPGGETSIVRVGASDVEISGFTFDGDNPLLTGIVVGGADIDARNGIITDWNLASTQNNLHVHDVTVQNVYLRGIQASPDAGSFNIHDNVVRNVQGDPESVAILNYGVSGTIQDNLIEDVTTGIGTNFSRGTTMFGNVVNNGAVGISSSNNGGAGGGSVGDVIGASTAGDANVVQNGPSGSYGILVYIPYVPVTVEGNTVGGVDIGLALLGGSVITGPAGRADFVNNTLTLVSASPGSVGILVSNDDFIGGVGDAAATMSVNTVTNFETGIDVEESTAASGDTTVTVTSGSVSGGATSVLLDGTISLMGDSLGSLSLSSPSGDYITLANAAYGNGIAGDHLDQIDATAVTFGGLTGSAMSPAQRAAVEAKLTHEPDDLSGSLGFILINVNDAPVAVADFYATPEDTTLNVPAPGVLSNDTDADGDTLTAVVVAGVAHGSLTLNGDGSFTYIPNANYAGADSFTYKANDGALDSNTVTVTITITTVNDDPVAVDDTYTTNEDTTLNVAAPGVLGNDTDVEGDTLSATVASGPSHGSLTLNPNGSFTYTPASNFNGSDSFTYTVSDGQGGTDTGLVTIGVNAVNDAPSFTAGPDQVAAEDSGAHFVASWATGISPGPANENGQMLTFIVTNDNTALFSVQPSVDPMGHLTYTLAPDANGVATVSVTLMDGGGTANGGDDTSDPQFFTITVTPVNDAPVANPDSYSTNEDTTLNVAAPGVLGNDSDVEGDTLSAMVATGPTHGSLTLNSNGSFTYTPNANYFGSDSFTYTVSDGQGGTDTGMVSITVNSVNDAPVAQDSSVTTNEDTPVMASFIASDVDGDPLTYTIVTPPAHGTVSISGNTFSYSPAPNYNGADSFTFKANDGTQDSNVATVSITVVSVNDAPVANDDMATVAEDSGPNTIFVLANDTDADGDALRVFDVSGASHGTVTIPTGGGSVIYTPDANYFGPDSFTYMITDDNGGTDTATVFVNVTNVNDAPVAVDDTATTAEDTPVMISSAALVANDTDVDGDTLTVTAVSNPMNGTVSLSGGTITFTPAANFHGSAGFDYTVSDGNGGTDTGHVTVTVTAVNDAPVAGDDAATTAEDTPLVIDAATLLANDTDIDGDTLTITAVSNPMHGTVTLSGTTITFTPAANYNGPASFDYTVSDGTLTDTGTVNITVTPVNDAPVAVDDTAMTAEDTPVMISSAALVANDTDADMDTLTVTAVSNPSNGTVSLSGGTITFTPAANFHGTAGFDYTVSDGNGGTDIGHVMVTVTSVNDAPVANDDSATVVEDSVDNVINVLGNDTDVDGDTLMVIAVGNATHGDVSLESDGTVLYTPDPNYFGPDEFTYTIKDGNGGFAMATVHITVTPVNDAPVANDDAFTTPEDTAVSGNVLTNDTDADADTLSATLGTGPTHGTLVLNADGSFTYTPAANFFGSDSFTYTASDGHGGTDTATVSITVTSVNDAPVAVDDAFTTAEDTPVSGNVLTNDTDVDGDTLTATLHSGVSHGTLVLNSDGSFTYTPDANFHGTDSFEYTANDGHGGTDTATVTITITAVNDAPVANDDSFTTPEDTAVSGNVLTNDTDVDGDTLSATLGASPAHGTLVLNADGSFTYTPNANFFGSDSFTYTASDGHGGTDTATVSITVTSVNDAPVANDDAFTTAEDTPVSGNVLTNDTDADGDTLSAAVATGPAHGTLVLNADGSFTYTPAANFNGGDSFTYTASDGNGGTDTATVTITITAVNDAPVANDDSFTTPEDTAVSGNVLTNDTDVDGDTLSATLGASPAHGTLVLNADGSFTYTPNANFFGSDSFTYTASDGHGGTDTATVSITVTSVNDAPVANDDAFTTAEDTPVSGNVLTNDTDADGDTLSAAVATGPAHGTLVLNADGSFTYTPAANFNGGDSFTYTASDGNGGTDTATVTITITAVNDAPNAVDDVAIVPEDSVLFPIPVLANDTDVDGDTLTVTAVGVPSHGIATVGPSGVFYTPTPNYVGPDAFTYTITDGHGGFATATVNVTVTNVNDAPVANDDAFTTAEDTPITLMQAQLTANDTDPDGNPLVVSGVSNATNGTVVQNPDGTITFTPAPNFHGTAGFDYTVSDGALSDTGHVTITVTSVNDAPVANDDAFTTAEDTPVSGNVLTNDTDADGDTLSAAVATGPAHGTLVLNADGSFTYTPAANFNGGDSFTYTASDGNGGTDTATVTITITAVNDAPVANDDSFTTPEDTAVSGNVLTNDTDVDGDTLSATLGASPAHGTLVLNADGSFTYTPNANFFGSDSFTYTASDGHGGTDTATVSITVTSVNDAPVANDDAFTTAEDTPVSGNVLTNDTDADGDTLSAAVATGPAHGTLVLNADGSFTYTPAANFNGGDSFTYTASDGNGGTDTATVTITITAVNDAPVAVDDTATTAEDTPLTINSATLVANDTDIDGGPLTVTAVSNPTNGTVSLSGGTITFTPAANFNGTAGFDYTVSDGNGGTDIGHVTIMVTPVADDPIAVDDNVTVAEDSVDNPINVLANDSDPDGDPLTVTEVGTPAHGEVSIGPGGVTYTPDPNFVGMDSFTYTISDGTGRTDTATVHVTVTNINDAPDAVNDTATTNEDTPVTIPVLANDTDPDGDTLTVTAVTQGANGTVTNNGTNVLYTPNANFNGSDSFTYTISDGNGGTDTATVSVTVAPINDAPDAVNDTATVNEDSTNNSINVLANDTDPDGDTLTVSAVTQGAHGTVTNNGTNVLYTPNANFNGSDSFTYTISDGNGGTDTATVSVTVAPINDAPDAVNDTANTNEDTPVTIMVLANDTDVDGDTLTITAVTQGANGTVTNNGTNVLYTPNANFNGSDSFTYTISDGNGGTDTATVMVTVAPVNDAPDAVNDTATVSEDSTNNVINVLANDTDAEGDTLTITAVTQGANGTVTNNGTNVLYTPNANFNGSDSFTYTISDGNGGTDTATVSVTVAPINDAPDAVNDTATVNEDSTNNSINVLANDTDPDGDTLTVSAVTQGAHGTVTNNGTNVLYTPAANFAGTDTFTYTVSDGNGGTDTATVTVNVLNIDTDFQGTNGDDVFLVKLDPTHTNIQVYDNDTGTGTPIFTAPLATTPSLLFDTLGGDDRLIIDFVNGNPMPSGGIQYLGGSNGATGDQLIVHDGGTANGSYSASPTTTGNGNVALDGKNVTLTGVEPITITGFNSFTVITPNPDDTLAISSPATATTTLSGTSGAVTLSPVTFANVATFIIDAATNDAGAGNDSLSVSASGLIPNGVGFLQYLSGTGANTLALQDGTTRIDSTVAPAGTLDTTVADGAHLTTHRLRQTSLTLGNGSSAVILPDGTTAATSVLKSLSIGTGGTLDINDNAVIVDYTGASPEAAIRAKILEGRGGSGVGHGTWTGTGITSTTAAQSNALNTESRSIGYANNGSLPLGSKTTFRGQPVDPTSILIVYTRTGDATLDGVVNDDDVTIVGTFYAPGVPRPEWAKGDFDFNGFVDNDDVTLLGAFYNPSAPGFPAPAPLMAAGEQESRGAFFSSLGETSSNGSSDAGDDELLEILAGSAASASSGDSLAKPRLSASRPNELDDLWAD